MIDILKNLVIASLFTLATSFNSFSAGSYSDSSESNSSSGSSSSSSSSSSYSSSSYGSGSNDSGTTTVPLTPEQKDIMLITVSLSKEDYENSYKLAKNATLTHPDNPDAWNYLGFSSRKLGKYDESEEAYKKALSIDPKHVGALEYYGELHLTLKQPKKAKLLLAELKTLCTINCKEMKQLEKAIQNYESN